MTDKEMLIYATAYRSLTKVVAEISNNSEDQKRFELIDWLIEQAEKAEKYRKALEFYADENIYDGIEVEVDIIDSLGTPIFDLTGVLIDDNGETARKALEGEDYNE